MHKLKTIIDYMIEVDFFRPQIKFKSTLGLDKEDAKKEEEGGFITKHPFAGFVSSVVSL